LESLEGNGIGFEASPESHLQLVVRGLSGEFFYHLKAPLGFDRGVLQGYIISLAVRSSCRRPSLEKTMGEDSPRILHAQTPPLATCLAREVRAWSGINFFIFLKLF